VSPVERHLPLLIAFPIEASTLRLSPGTPAVWRPDGRISIMTDIPREKVVIHATFSPGSSHSRLIAFQ
jgi:hypothetical protein